MPYCESCGAEFTLEEAWEYNWICPYCGGKIRMATGLILGWELLLIPFGLYLIYKFLKGG